MLTFIWFSNWSLLRRLSGPVDWLIGFFITNCHNQLQYILRLRVWFSGLITFTTSSHFMIPWLLDLHIFNCQ